MQVGYFLLVSHDYLLWLKFFNKKELSKTVFTQVVIQCFS
ncbi:hypothetical protein SORDD25_00591 [Streptococcus oralis]|uniref:Uncharacterized protein n=1 Tax=Streptococcus oralis TaxID=1303 RepID=A0A139R0K2_STROR|nr:hypothetical protein SORDD25_00591 [Streptococcus oralis]